jgi:hypothetical protein
MHAAEGILTERGGMTSHAAVIARGLGVPCVVGATRMQLDLRKKTLTVPGRQDLSTRAIRSRSTAPPARCWWARRDGGTALDGAFATLMDWADAARDIGVRANADTPADAAMAQRFGRRDRAVPDRAHVLRRRPPDGDARDDLRRERPPTGPRRWSFCCRCSATISPSCSADHAGPAGLHPPVRPAAARIPARRPRRHARAGRGAGPAGGAM